MRRDPTMIVLGEDVGRKGGVFLTTDGLWAEFGEDRVIDTPLTESLIVGASIGAAVNGLRPVPEIQFADFIFPAFNQIVSEAARLRYRSNNAFGCPITIRAPYGGGVHGALYHSQEAAELVAGEGISVEVIDLRTLRPLDTETILGSVKKTGKCVIVYEDNRFGGYGAEVAAVLAEEAFDYLDGPVVRVAGPDVPGVPYSHTLEDWFMVDPDKIAAAVRHLAAY